MNSRLKSMPIAAGTVHPKELERVIAGERCGAETLCKCDEPSYPALMADKCDEHTNCLHQKFLWNANPVVFVASYK